MSGLSGAADLDPNFTTGRNGLIAVDKIANEILFLDPDTFETTLSLGGFAPRVHELTISADHRTAYVPIYGDGIHGDNPNPGHLIAVIDLEKRRHAGDFSTAPYLAPHGLRWGRDGRFYCVCENSGVLLEMDPKSGDIKRVIPVGSNKAHRIEVTPDGSKLYIETEEDSFVSVLDLRTLERLPNISVAGGLAGLAMSPDGKTVILVDGSKPLVHVVDTATDTICRVIELEGYKTAAQIARYSPSGDYMVVTSVEEPLATIFSAELAVQRLVHIGKTPMNMAYHSDGRTLLIGNQGDGTISVVDLERAEVVRSVPVGKGVETLSFF